MIVEIELMQKCRRIHIKYVNYKKKKKKKKKEILVEKLKVHQQEMILLNYSSILYILYIKCVY